MDDQPTPYDDLPEINSYDEIPAFASEEEEARFWGTHALGPELLNAMEQNPLSARLKERDKLLAAQRSQREPKQRKGPVQDGSRG